MCQNIFSVSHGAEINKCDVYALSLDEHVLSTDQFIYALVKLKKHFAPHDVGSNFIHSESANFVNSVKG